MSRIRLSHLRRLWIGWLRFEYRAIAVLLPISCFELSLADSLLAHLPALLGMLGVSSALLAPGVWRFAAQIDSGAPRMIVPDTPSLLE